MSDLFFALQLALDAALLAAVGYLFWRLHGKRGQATRPVSPQDLEAFLAEAAQLSREFERLLAEKRELIGATLTTLDTRINRMRQMADQLEQTPAPAPSQPASAPSPPQPQGFRAQVLELARQGQAPARIAQALGRPLGEVELVLQLHKS